MNGGDVETARGPVPATSLGRTLMHEHVFTMDVEYQQNFPDGWGDEAARVADAVQHLDELKGSGIDTIVDLTVLGLGRHVPRICRVAEQSEVNIVLATGVYTFDDVPRPFRFVGPGLAVDRDDPLVDLFVTELTVGIGATGRRAGMLKCATGINGFTPGVERVLRAVAAAQAATGAPITTHSVARLGQGLRQQDILEQHGADLTRVVIGHCGDAVDLDYLRAIADRGSYLGMDQFGIEHLCPFEERVETVARLCELGYSDRMVLSQDYACFADILDDDARAALNPHWSYLRVTEDVVPALLERGVDPAHIDQMLVTNPRTILSMAA